MKKHVKIICFITGIVLICIILVYLSYPKYALDQVYVKEYITNEEGIKGNVDITNLGDNSAYEIGANRGGYAVFKKPNKAFHQMKLEFKKGIAAIRKEHFLLPLSRWNYKKYKTYGWQLNGTVDAEASEQAGKISALLDIYENSFK